jgi:DNA polymerase IV
VFTPLPRIVCLDLDTFFVSVERLYDPSLVGKAVVVGATGTRGVVTAASYEVRESGVRSGMPISKARRLAPHAIYVAPRHGVYSPYAKKVRGILERFTPAVQTASIDEFYLDFAGCERMLGAPEGEGDEAVLRAVWAMRQAIQDELGLPASAGIGTSRAIAKMATKDAKPAGVCMVPAGGEVAFLTGRPVRALPGIGPAAEQRLIPFGITTLEQLLDLAPGPARARFAGLQARVMALAAPRCQARLSRDRPAFREHDPDGLAVGSISNERTFRADEGDEDIIDAQLVHLAQRVCWRARKRAIRARTITLKVRYSDFDTITRSKTVPATHDESDVLAIVRRLYKSARTRPLPIRLLGVGLSNLIGRDDQLSLPFGQTARPAVGRALDAVRARHGYESVQLGGRTKPASFSSAG